MRGNGLGKHPLRRRRGRHHQQAGGMHIDAVHDAGAGEPAEIRPVVQQPIDQRAVRVAGTRMHRDARGFVDHQAMFVFMNDRETDLLRDGPVSRRRAGGAVVGIPRQGEALATLHFPVGFRAPAVDRERALPYPSRQHRPGIAAEKHRGDAVGPLAGQVRGNFGFKAL